MSDTGLDVFDKTLHSTHAWLGDIGEAVGGDKQHQYRALRAVLFALRDRLGIEEAFHLSSHLPMLVRGIYWEGYRPTGKPDVTRSLDEFLDKVSENLEAGPDTGAEQVVRAVFDTLQLRIDGGELEHVKRMVPEDVRALFSEGRAAEPA